MRKKLVKSFLLILVITTSIISNSPTLSESDIVRTESTMQLHSHGIGS
jgi:hypothetical protein